MDERMMQITTEFLANRQQLMSFIYGLVRQTQIAEDIFQETWLKLANSLQQGTAIERPAAWCRKVAKNLVLEYWRKQANSKVVVDSALIEFIDYVEMAFEESADDRMAERQQALNACVEALPEKSKRLLALKYDECYSMEKIAEAVEQSTAAVSKALLRLRQALAVCVQKKLKLSELGL